MTTVEQTITRVRRRKVLAAAMHRGAVGLSAGLGAGILVVVTLRLAGWPGPAAVIGLLATLGLLAGLATAWTIALPRRRIATEVDALFNLRDRLGSALALDAGNAAGTDPAFAAYVRADAQAQLRRVSTRLAGPVAPTRAWAIAAVLAVLATAVALWLPQRERGPLPDEPLSAGPTLTSEDRQLATEIDDALQDIEDLPEQDAVQDDVAALRELARQLEAGADGVATPASPETRRAQSAARIAEVAETLARDAEQDLARADELTRRFRRLPDNERTADAAALRDALERGDFGDAADQLEQLVRDDPTGEPDRRETLSDDLRGLAREVEAAGQSSESARTQRADQLEQALRDQGVTPEETEQLLEQDAETLENTLREIGADPELSRRLAEDIAAHRERSEVDDQIREDAEAIAESIEEAADTLTEPAAEDTPAEEPDAAGAADAVDPVTETSPTDVPAPSSNEPPSNADADPSPDPDPSSTDEPPRPRPGQTDQTQQQQQQPQPGEPPSTGAAEQPEGQPSPEPGQQPEGTKPSPESEKPPGAQRPQPGEPRERQQAEGTQEQPQQEQERPQQQDQQDQQQQQDQPQQEDQQQQATEQSPEDKPRRGASRVLREMAKRIAQAAEKAQRSEKLAEKARKMIEGMDPEQRRKLAEQAKKLFENLDEQQMKKLAEKAQRMFENMTPEEREQLQKTLEQTPPEQREAMRKQMEEALGETTPDQQQEMADRMRKAFEQMPPGQREQMQEMLENMNPQQQRDLARGLAGRSDGRGGQAGAPGPSAGDNASGTATRLGAETDDLDLAGDETVDRVIARWTDPDGEPAASGAVAERTARGRVRSAQDIAERAVNDSALPRRYHRSVRRYFERLPDTVEQAVEKKRQDATDEGS